MLSAGWRHAVRGERLAVVGMVIVAALGVGACSGDQKEGVSDTRTEPCLDTAQQESVWPGGQFTVSAALDPDDAVAAEREEAINSRLLLIAWYFRDEPTDCLDSFTLQMGTLHADLYREMSFLVPVGWTCAYAMTIYDPLETDPETGDEYTITCAGMTVPAYIDQETDAMETLDVACYRIEREGEPE